MLIRPARVPDAETICALINDYAERGLMLHRSLESVYDSLRDFIVAEGPDERLAGCVALDVFWSDLAEVKSLAVAPGRHGAGIGSQLLAAALDDARRLGIRKVFALTYEQSFFVRHGFATIERDTLPEKVWRECLACPKSDQCDEIAMLLDLADD